MLDAGWNCAKNAVLNRILKVRQMSFPPLQHLCFKEKPLYMDKLDKCGGHEERLPPF